VVEDKIILSQSFHVWTTGSFIALYPFILFRHFLPFIRLVPFRVRVRLMIKDSNG